VRAQRTFGDNIDTSPEPFGKRSLKSDEIEKRPSVLHRYEQINIAGLSLSAASKRSEDANVLGAMLL
jgi:hypothetical protein